MTHTHVAFIGGLLLGGAALAQTRPVPRTADGKPDLTGVWQGGSNRVGTWEEANSPAAGAEFGTGRGQAAPGAKQLPPREPPPYQPWAAKKVLEFYNRRGIDDPEARCVAPGVPRITTIGLFPMEVVQTPQKIVMLYEVFSVFRIIPLNAKHPDDLEPSYMGDSVGHWEGDALVVDVTSFNDKTWLGPSATTSRWRIRTSSRNHGTLIARSCFVPAPVSANMNARRTTPTWNVTKSF
jgi:hypothetical protein